MSEKGNSAQKIHLVLHADERKGIAAEMLRGEEPHRYTGAVGKFVFAREGGKI